MARIRLKYIFLLISFVLLVNFLIKTSEYDMTSLARLVGSATNSSSNKTTRIFCMMLTVKSNLNTKARLMLNTWLHKCDNYRLVLTLDNKSRASFDDGHFLQPAELTNDTYTRLTDKVFRTVMHVSARYPDYDWYVKADDDTYMFAENLRWFLSQQDSSQPVTYGYNFKVRVDGGFQGGGAGYAVSREAFKRLGDALRNNYSYCTNTGIEDSDVHRCLRNLYVCMRESIDEHGRERFHSRKFWENYYGNVPGWVHEFVKHPVRRGFDCCSETTISFHKMNETEIRELDRAYRHVRKRQDVNKSKNYQQDFVNFHEIMREFNLTTSN